MKKLNGRVEKPQQLPRNTNSNKTTCFDLFYISVDFAYPLVSASHTACSRFTPRNEYARSYHTAARSLRFDLGIAYFRQQPFLYGRRFLVLCKGLQECFRERTPDLLYCRPMFRRKACAKVTLSGLSRTLLAESPPVSLLTIRITPPP